MSFCGSGKISLLHEASASLFFQLASPIQEVNKSRAIVWSARSFLATDGQTAALSASRCPPMSSIVYVLVLRREPLSNSRLGCSKEFCPAHTTHIIKPSLR